MPFKFSRLKQWIGYENVSNADLNAEFNNMLQKSGADTLSSANSTSGSTPTVTSMQALNNPGTVGTENIAQTLQQDIQQLRFQLEAIIGGAQWYSAPAISISNINSELSTLQVSSAVKIISGRNTTFGQPDFLVPDGAAKTVYLRATTTNLSTYINSVPVIFTADLTLTGLTAAPSSNNTAAATDLTLGGAASSKLQGERNTIIQLTAVGSAIQALAGTYQCFKVGSEVFIGEVQYNNTSISATFTSGGAIYTGAPTMVTVTAHGLSTNDQVYFTGGSLPTGISANTVYAVTVVDVNTFYVSASVGGALVSTSTTGSGTCFILKSNCLKNCYRGWFFDSTDAAIARATITTGATITLLKASWVFVTNNGVPAAPALDVVYNRPTTSIAQPTSPASGDYWFDLTAQTWKKYSGTAFNATNAVLLGVAVQDATNCIAARSFDYANTYSSLNTIEPEYLDTTDVRTSKLSDKCSIYGTSIKFDYDVITWNIANNMDTGLTIGASTTYYLYLTSAGKPIISDAAPHQRRFDLLGDYHPNKPYRCVGSFVTTSGSLVSTSNIFFHEYHQAVLPYGFVRGQTIPTSGITNTMYAPASIDTTKLGAVNKVVSSSCSSYSTSSSGAITNFSNNMVCTGRPVKISIQSDGTAATSVVNVGASAGSSVNSASYISFSRDSTEVCRHNIGFNVAVSTGTLTPTWRYPPSSFNFTDYSATAGPHLYTANAVTTGSTGVNMDVTNCVFVTEEEY